MVITLKNLKKAKIKIYDIIIFSLIFLNNFLLFNKKNYII